MKITTVKKYHCDFCKKTGYSAGHMRRHESACTMNPNRVCRVCQMDHGEFEQGEADQPKLSDLLKILPDPNNFLEPPLRDEYGVIYSGGIHMDQLGWIVNSILPTLREISGNCPACIMAALRQKGIPIPLVTDFNFTEEMKGIWGQINEKQRDDYSYY